MAVINLTKDELAARGETHRWLATNSSMSATYLLDRLNGKRPFNTNDLAELAALFGYTPESYARAAGERRPKLSVVPPVQDDGLEEIELSGLDLAATAKEDTGEPDTP